MAYSSGTFSRLYDFTDDRDNGIRIQAARMDAELDGMATGLTTAILKDGSQTTTAVVPFAYGISIVDNQSATFGTTSDYTLQYDETTRDSLFLTSNVEGAAFKLTLAADQGDDASDEWQVGISTSGVLTIGNDIASAQTYVSQLTLTPHATVASSTTAVLGNLTVGGSLSLGSAVIAEAELEMLDGITAGTVIASKALVADANIDITGGRNITITGELAAATLDISGNIDIDGTSNLDVVDIDGAVDMASTLGVAGVVTANAGVVVDNITIDGTEIDLSSGDLTLDVAGDIILDAAGGDIKFLSDGTEFGEFRDISSDLVLISSINNKDIVFKGQDNGLEITALTLDMSADGAAIFKSSVAAVSLDISGDVDIDGTLEADAMTLNGTAITATATLDTGISNNNVPKFTSGVADDDFLRVNGTAIEGRSASEVLSDIGGQAALTFGISDTNIPIFTSGVADDDFLRVNGTSIEGRSASEVLSDIGASAVAGSSSIVTTGALNAGSITSGFGTIDTGSSNITSTGVGAFGSLDISGDIDVDGTTNLDVVDIDGAVDMASTLGVAGVVTANAGVVVDNITIDGTEIDLSSGDLTLDVAGDIILDADGGDIKLKDGSTIFGELTNNESADGNFDIKCPVSDADIRFKGNDGGATITALSLDMSSAGSATFNHDIKLPDNGIAYFGAGFDLAISSDGTNGTIAAPNGTLTIDCADDISLDAAGGDIKFLSAGTEFGEFRNISNDLVLISSVNDKDIVFKGQDGGSEITALTLDMSAGGNAFFNSAIGIGISSGASAQLDVRGSNASIQLGEVNQSQFFRIQVNSSGYLTFNDNDAAERMRIETNGNFLVGTTNQSPAEGTTAGTRIGSNGGCQFSASGIATFDINRAQDGGIVNFRSAGTAEGSVSISGSTTSYNAFSGSHWSRLSDNSKPTILKGTIIETIDEMCDWYQAEFTKVAKVENGVEVLAEEAGRKTPIALPDGKSVGDTISITYEGITYDDAVIVKESDNKHTKCKISDIADSKRVYGVHAAWDNDDDTVNDMYVTAVGTHVVRINKDVTVSAGDLLSSNGDGTAKVQDDDIIRSKTIGKVLTNIKQETYSDGSYTVPCALYCG